MRVGLIGYGGMGRHHAGQTEANPHLELVAIADASEEARDRAEEEHHVPTFATGEELIRYGPVEGIVIVAPTFLHEALIVAGARAGKHVFCEKPLCLPMHDPSAVHDAVASAGVTFGFGLVLRYMTAYRAAKERIENGSLGKVVLAHARYGAMLGEIEYVFNPEVGGGLLNEHTIHMVDALDYLLGPVQSVAARFNRQPGRRTEDNTAILLRFEGDRIATLAGSGMTRWPSRIEITGTCGEIAVTGNSRLEVMTEQGIREISLPDEPDPYGREVEEWRRAIRENRPPVTGMREALRITALITAIHEAARTERWVDVPQPSDSAG